ncbi:MAG: hypothetical protein GY833_17320 [Aestuariibacter sp.]|nr:hypothetical protein [Aestuariibacter sp.]
MSQINKMNKCLAISTMTSIFICLVGFSNPSAAQESSLPAQTYSGFALELHIGTGTMYFLDDDIPVFSSLQGGFFLGHKIDRVTYGLGFDIWRNSYTRKSEFDDRKSSMISFLLVPGVRVAIVRSDDERVELIGQVDVGIGTSIYKQKDEDEEYEEYENDYKYFNFTYAVGPGLRYWVHPQFAIGVVAGLRGELLKVSNTESDYSRLTHLMSIFGLAQFTGVF